MSGGIYSYSPKSELSPFKFFRFRPEINFCPLGLNFLAPPCGENLPEVLRTNPEVTDLVGEIFDEYGLKVSIEKLEEKIKVGWWRRGVTISQPYLSASETLRRLVFNLTALKTCKESILAFEEPEAHAFPFYTKYLAELIASDVDNQYFVSTHNPHFLLPLIEKSSEIAVFLTEYRDFQTEVKQCGKEEMNKMLEYGSEVFFNLEWLAE